MAQIIDLGKFRFNWLGDYNIATEYERNDTIKYGGNVYVYTLDAASIGNLPTDTAFWALMLEGFNYRGDWDVADAYELSDLVTYGGKVYLALRDTTADNPATASLDWSVFVEGIQYEGNWDTAIAYQVGDVVKYGGVVYIAVQNSSAATPSLISSIWDVFVYGLEYMGSYDDAVSYKLNDIVLYGGTSYIALQPGTGNEPAPGSYWAIFTQGFQFEGDWDTLVDYQSGDLVRYGGIVYVALQDSSATSPENVDYWAILTEGIAWKGVYSSETTYNKNDIVSSGGSSWIAKINTTGNIPAVTSYWDLLAAGTFPSFVGNSGKFLSNDGNTAVWVSDVTVTSVNSTEYVFVGVNGLNDFTEVGTNVNIITNRALTSNVVTISTGDFRHYFAVGQSVIIALDPPNAVFDGEQEIIEIPDIFTFTYAKINGNVASAGSGGTASAVTGYTNAVIVVGVDNDDYSQIAFRNASAMVNASTDFIAYPDNGNDFSGYIDMGITSSVFSDPDFTITGPNDGYIFVTAPIGSLGNGNLVLATGATGLANKIIFAAGGLDSNSSQMEITPNENVKISIETPSTSATTGALQVVGGVGIAGDLNVQGNVSIVGQITFGGEGTVVSTANLAVDAAMIFSSNNNVADLLDGGIITEYAASIGAITKTVSNKALTSNVARLTTSTSHTYLVGDVVVVTDVDATFNGTYVILNIPSTTTFEYTKVNSDVVSVGASGTTVVSARRAWAGIVRDASDSATFKVFQGLSAKPVTTVDFADVGLSYSPFKIGALTSTTGTFSTGVVSTAGTNALKDLTLSGSSNTFGSSSIAGDFTVTSDPTFSGTPVFSGNPSFTGTPTFTGGVRVQEMIEDVVDVALSSNVATLDYSAGNIFFTSNTPSAAMTFGLTNAPTTNGRAFTVNVVVTQGATGYIPTTFTINGDAVTMKWAAGVAPIATSSSGKIDMFSLTIIRRASTYTLLGSANLNF